MNNVIVEIEKFENDLEEVGDCGQLMFMYHGRKCWIVRHPMGYLSGYAELGVVMPFRAKNEVVCHGGVTYCGNGLGVGLDDRFYVGLDCMQSSDWTPWSPRDNGIYRNVSFVRDELKDVVRQLEEMEGAR